jgi:hypothetical protein
LLWACRCCRRIAWMRIITIEPGILIVQTNLILPKLHFRMDSLISSSNAEAWIVLNHDYSWEEVVLNGMDGWFIDDDIPQPAALPPAPRAFDAARLSDVCRGFRSSLERMDSHLQVPPPPLKSHRLRRANSPSKSGRGQARASPQLNHATAAASQHHPSNQRQPIPTAPSSG